MKNIFCTLGLIVALVFSSTQSIFCQAVSSSDAEKVALNFMKTQNPQAQILASHHKVTSAENSEEALIHVFNFQPGGFVLVAGDKKSTPVLGYSDKSNFDLEHLNPEVAFYLNEMKEQVAFLKKEIILAPMQASWDKFLKGTNTGGAESGITVGPFLNTKWSQGKYYNEKCPVDAAGPAGHVHTGCVATAMAQLIKFHNSPAYGKGDHMYYHNTYGTQGADFENTKYNWSNMPTSLTSSNADVATLMYHCGVAVDMNYSPSGSEAGVAPVAPALQNYFSFSNSMQWITYFLEQGNFGPKLKADLDLGHPTFMTGCAAFIGSCHAWICEGYDYIPGVQIYYTMNWGWGGASDGNFAMGNFNTGTYSFDWHLTAITNIEPACPRNVNLTAPVLAGFPMEVIETITVNVPITPSIPIFGKYVNYDAGKSVQMNPGFVAEGNTVVFSAFIQGCGGPTLPFTEEGSGDRVEEEPSVINPAKTGITLNVHPNPFTSSTTIAYELPSDQVVDIQIFSATGNLVDQPVRQEQQDAGPHEYHFEANSLPNGVYFLVMQADGKRLNNRLVLAR